ncbi:PHB depolymerase family esterase [Streptomyces sp. NPDC001312]|uniref:PHB depolymerase family esterase n=1 Tax=Streptomyces sp. NPDC001312 TaxID=3364561 RepID=UPI0036B6C8C9
MGIRDTPAPAFLAPVTWRGSADRSYGPLPVSRPLPDHQCPSRSRRLLPTTYGSSCLRSSTLRRLFRRTALAAAIGGFAAGLTTVTALAPTAGILQQVTNFGSNPGNLAMYEYALANLPANVPLVVALHGCSQSASDHHAHSGWQKFADQWGFAVVYPPTSAANNLLS